MNTDPRIDELKAVLLRPGSVQDIRAALELIDESSGEPELSTERAMVIRHGFGCLRELTAGDPDVASTVLMQDLLPRCLKSDQGGDQQKSPRYDTVFGDWLNGLPEQIRRQVRQAAIPAALAALGGDGVRNALRLISSVGYWEDQLLARLDEIIEAHDDEIGDHALSVRVGLAPMPPERSPWLIESLDNRIMKVPGVQRGQGLHLLAAAQVIGTIQTAENIWASLVLRRRDLAVVNERDIIFEWKLKLLAQILVRHQNDSLSGEIWSWLISNDLDGEKDSVLNSGLGPELNVADVIPELLRRAGNHSRYLPYMYYRQIRDCILPAHLAVWNSLGEASLACAQRDATKPSGVTGQYSTVAISQKDSAWDILLCRGDRSILPPFDEALAGEPSGYVLNQFLDLASCLALPTLPPRVHSLLASDPDHESWSDQERITAQVGAIHAAHGAANGNALAALLGYRPVGEHGVLLSLVDALAETVLVSLRIADRMVTVNWTQVRQLLVAAEEAVSEDTRGAAAAAMARLVEQDRLLDEEVHRAAALAMTAATTPYARRELLFAFAASLRLKAGFQSELTQEIDPNLVLA